jgi:hypothetical protein
MRRAMAQKPNKQKIRKTRWAVIRNTNPQLKTTTIKTWLDWFGPEMGKFKWSLPYTHEVKFQLPDKTTVDCEVIFLALDRPEDIKRLLSLELTGLWVNEAREVSKAIIDACTMRVGRFPSMREGGPTWFGVIMDTNAPDEEHWWAIMSGERPPPEWMTTEERILMVKPDNWRFFKQPPAMVEQFDASDNLTGYVLNKRRENGKNLVEGYYRNIITGKSRSWIKVYVLNQYQSLSEGKQVHPSFNPEIHVARELLSLAPNTDIYCGIDFGRTPAAVIGQKMLDGQWIVIKEVLAQNMGAKRFAEVLKTAITALMPHENQVIKFFGDPAGSNLSQADETSPFIVFRQAGIQVVAAPTNDIDIRLEAVDGCLNRMIDGKPAILISKNCTSLKIGFESGYQYRRKQVGGQVAVYDDVPFKNRYSHPQDALQYMLMGGGEGRRVLTGHTKAGKVTYARQGQYDPFARRTLGKPQKARRRGF